MGLEQLKAYVRLRVKTSKFKDFKGVRGNFPPRATKRECVFEN